MAALTIWAPLDGVLGMVAPLALAAAAPGPALVVDLDPEGPRYPGGGSLAELVESGPRLVDLRPIAAGVAVLRNGGIDINEADEVVNALIAGWPNIVLRAPSSGSPQRTATVPVVPLLPDGLTRPHPRAAVYQQLGWHEKAPGPALTLPTPSRSTVTNLLTGQIPPVTRWLQGWRRVWELPWA